TRTGDRDRDAAGLVRRAATARRGAGSPAADGRARRSGTAVALRPDPADRPAAGRGAGTPRTVTGRRAWHVHRADRRRHEPTARRCTGASGRHPRALAGALLGRRTPAAGGAARPGCQPVKGFAVTRVTFIVRPVGVSYSTVSPSRAPVSALPS